MLQRKDLEALHPTTLAVLCGKLAEVSHDQEAVTKARELKQEWSLLQTPPSSSYREEKAKDAKRWENRQRMIDFLDGRDEVEFYPKQ